MLHTDRSIFKPSRDIERHLKRLWTLIYQQVYFVTKHTRQRGKRFCLQRYVSNDNCQSSWCCPGLHLLLRCCGVMVGAKGRPERNVSKSMKSKERSECLTCFPVDSKSICLFLRLDIVHVQKSSRRRKLEAFLWPVSTAAQRATSQYVRCLNSSP